MNNDDDPYDDPDLKAYLAHAKENMFPMLKNSMISLTILNADPDPKLCLELGASILFDKPLVILVPDRTVRVPANLKRVATKIVYGHPNDADTREELKKIIEDVIANDQRSRH